MNKKKLLPGALIAYIAAMIAVMAACKKDPVPGDNPTPGPTSDTITPIVPGDTITPVDTIVPTPPTPGDTIVPTPPTPGDTIGPTPPDVPWDTVMLPIKLNNVEPYNILYPMPDTIQKLIDSRKVVKLKWYVPPNLTNGWTPDVFRFPRDSLKVRFAMSDKIVGEGKIYVNKNYGGASIPCEDSLNFLILGMTKCDSAVFAGWGFEPYVKYSKSQRDAHVKFCDTIGMRRAVLGGKKR